MNLQAYESLSEAARRLHTSAVTVSRWIDSGKLKGIRPSARGPRFALKADVDRLLAEKQGN